LKLSLAKRPRLRRGKKVLPPKDEARRTGAPLLAARAIGDQFDAGGSQRPRQKASG